MGEAYDGKRVLVTGHTGFKGSWLALWLTSLGAEVTGVSSYLPSEPCNFTVLGLGKRIDDRRCDVRDLEALRRVFDETRPEVVFHLAAQTLVRKSYDDPKLTFDTNLGGTVNMLECIRAAENLKAAVIITSDKCYHNVEWPWGYRENDRLGGEDPYGASKACAEIAFHSYVQSFLPRTGAASFPRMATTRAGNVIGGGDWAEARILPDCIKALTRNEPVIVRNPEATRPWQHVLEPLSGYLWLGSNLLGSGEFHGEAFNFGPDRRASESVREVVELLIACWGSGSWEYREEGSKKKENVLLKLSCEKAFYRLGWHPALSFEETIRMTAAWYKAFYAGERDMYEFSLGQIGEYIREAKRQGVAWA
jgi:CDP-glucose 4,6-dehydratase